MDNGQSFEDALDREILALTQELIRYNSKTQPKVSKSKEHARSGLSQSKIQSPDENPYIPMEDSIPLDQDDSAPLDDVSQMEGSRENQNNDADIKEHKQSKIDLVLVHDSQLEMKTDPTLVEARAKRRAMFEKNLKRQGFKIECIPSAQSLGGKKTYWLLRLPYHLLIVWAERLKIRLPLFGDPTRTDYTDTELTKSFTPTGAVSSFYHAILTCYNLTTDHADHRPTLPFIETRRLTGNFNAAKIELFHAPMRKLHVPDAIRIIIASHLIKKTSHGPDTEGTGIDDLVQEMVFTDCYPMHDSNYLKDEDFGHVRRYLYEHWARWCRWYKFQPLDVIRYYFGENIATYLTFIGFYVEMLFLPAISSVIVLLYSWRSEHNNDEYTELCIEDSGRFIGNRSTCPDCNGCNYTKFSAECEQLIMSQIFSNTSAYTFTILMTMWTCVFVLMWKRRLNDMTYLWDISTDNEEGQAEEYEELIRCARGNYVVRMLELVLADKARPYRKLASFTMITLWICLVFFAVSMVMIYRVVIFQVSPMQDSPIRPLLSGVSISIVHYIVMTLLNLFYRNYSLWLTKMERPPTARRYMESYTYKIFCFKCIHRYSYLSYVAYVKPVLAGRPGAYVYALGWYRWDECDKLGCLTELNMMMLTYMVIDLLSSFFVGYMILPLVEKLKRYMKSRDKSFKSLMENFKIQSWERDNDLMRIGKLEIHRMIGDRLMQFGFVTMFSAACPYSSIMALTCNIVEMRLTARMFICRYRRPIPLRCSDMRSWFPMMEFVMIASVFTNAVTIAFTSDAIIKLVYRYAYSNTSSYRHWAKWRLSAYDINDLRDYKYVPDIDTPHNNMCYYRDFRFGPTHAKKYQVTEVYWHVMWARYAFILFMALFVLVFNFIMGHMIPENGESMEQAATDEQLKVDKLLHWSTTINDARDKYVSDTDDDN